MLHYALLKSVRERSVWGFLLGPLVLLGAPLLGVAADAAYAGRRVHPILLPGMSVAGAERAYAFVGTAAVVAAAGAAAFWCFRSDVANRSLSFLLLGLRRPVIAPVAAALFGWCAGMAAFVAVIPLVTLAVGTMSRIWLSIAVIAAVAGLLSAAIGTVFAAYAPAPGSLAMVTLIGGMITVIVAEAIESMPMPAIAGALAATVMLLAIAGRGMERRCAA
jgi:hypothetical protein